MLFTILPIPSSSYAFVPRRGAAESDTILVFHGRLLMVGTSAHDFSLSFPFRSDLTQPERTPDDLGDAGPS